MCQLSLCNAAANNEIALISSFTNSFFPLAQVKKAAKRQVEKAAWLIRKSWLLFTLLRDKKNQKSYGK